MKQRLITGLLWGSLAILTMVYLFTPLMGILISLFSVIAVFEIQRVAKVVNVPVRVMSLAVAAAIPTLSEYHVFDRFNIPLTPVLVGYTILLLALMLMQYEKTKFEHIAIVLFTSIAVPFALSTFMLVRDVYDAYPGVFQKSQAFFLFFTGLSCAWITDMFAYFVGSKLGKHKMAPKISPKKSIEGAIGGIVCTIVFNALSLLIFSRFFDKPIFPFWVIVPVTVVLSVVGMLGDLSASVIKRNYGEKDFGTLMKGHGGVMDRFDSCIFVFPFLYSSIIVWQSL